MNDIVNLSQWNWVYIEKFAKAKGISFHPYRNVSNNISFYSKNIVIHYAEVLYEKRKCYPKVRCQNVFSLSAKSFILKKDELVIHFGKKFSNYPLRIPIDLDSQKIEKLKMGEILKLDIKRKRNDYFAKIVVSIHMNSKPKNVIEK